MAKEYKPLNVWQLVQMCDSVAKNLLPMLGREIRHGDGANFAAPDLFAQTLKPMAKVGFYFQMRIQIAHDELYKLGGAAHRADVALDHYPICRRIDSEFLQHMGFPGPSLCYQQYALLMKRGLQVSNY